MKRKLAFEVGMLKDKVTIDFDKPVFSLSMSPDEARALADALLIKINEIEHMSSQIITVYVTAKDTKNN